MKSLLRQTCRVKAIKIDKLDSLDQGSSGTSNARRGTEQYIPATGGSKRNEMMLNYDSSGEKSLKRSKTQMPDTGKSKNTVQQSDNINRVTSFGTDEAFTDYTGAHEFMENRPVTASDVVSKNGYLFTKTNGSTSNTRRQKIP